MKDNKFKIKGIMKTTGSPVYMGFKIHKGVIFYSLQKEPTNFETVSPDKYIELQLIAQKELNNVTWITKNSEERNIIANKVG